MYRKNVAGQFYGFTMTSATTGAATAGLTVTVTRIIDGGTKGAITGSVVDISDGNYRLDFSQADTNGNNITFFFSATGMNPFALTITTTAADPTDAASFGITRIDAAISSRMATYTQPTGFLAATFPGTVASPTNITAGTITTVSGNVNGSVGSVTGAVGSVTGNVGGTVASVVGDVGGNVVGTVASVVGNVGGNVTGSVGSVVGNVGGNLTGSVGSVVGNVGGDVVGSVGSVLGNLGGNVVGSVASVVGNVGGDVVGTVASVVGNVGGNVVGSVNAVINPVDLTTAGNEAIADAVLLRNVAGGSNTGRTVREAFYFLRNRWTVTTGTLTVYETDDATTSWTAVVTGTPGADPITGNDPA
jgi:hypothetical protein